MLAAAVSDEDRVPLPADASRPVEERPGQVEVGSREPRPEAVARLGAGESGHGQKRRASGFPGSFGLWLGGTALLVAIGLGLTFALERGPWTRGSESDIPSGQMNGGKSEGPQEREEAQKTGTTAGQETIEKGTFSGSSEAATLGRSGVAEDAPAGGSDQPQGEGTPPPTTSRPATRLQTEPVEGVQEPPPETVPRARVQAEPETMGRGTTSWSSETASPGRARTVEDAPAGESNQPQGEGTPPPTTSEPSSRQTREPAVTQADTSSKTGSQTACTDDIAVVIAVDSRYREAVLSKFGVLRIGKAGCWQMELRFQEPRVSDAARGGGSIWKACDVEASFHLRYKNQDIVDTTIRRNAVKLEEPQACSAAARDVATAAVRKVAVRCAECTVPRSGS